ncbi:MAG: DUF177 domain-containing protein [Dehalococcoidales bacterium]|nr:DUF177 domain-containing protein [Dehalococcoidales bacterium]
MQINVAQQLRSSIGSIRDYEVKQVIDVIGDGKGSLVQGKVRLMRTDQGILVKGRLDIEVKLTCGRCLSLFGCPLALDIEEEYFPTTDVVSGAPLSLPEEFGGFTIDEHHELDLTEAIHQYALLAMPMKPLCREDCAGLCPHCGHNLNLGACNCPPQGADPRWSELSRLASAGNDLMSEEKGTQ